MPPRIKPKSPTAQRHADWIGMLQPEGLVVSIAVLEELDLYVRQDLAVQQRLRELTPDDALPGLTTLLHDLLGWKPERVQPAAEHPGILVDLDDLGVTLRPDAVAVDRQGEVLLLLRWIDGDPDATPAGDRWPASHTERFERLLTRSGHPVGLLASPGQVRLVFAPAGQAPGRLTFPVHALRAADGSLLVDALFMLLGTRRVFAAPKGKRLLDVLQASRERQERVTEQLAAQVEDALRVLIEGFDTANERTKGALLRDVSGAELYDGLSTVLLRLVFLLYAEDRGLLPMEHPVYAESYSVVTLGDQLAEDAVAHGEAQSRRYGAWARIVSLFRMIWSGARHPGLVLPARQGDLFHPDRYPFLEGRPPASQHRTDPVAMPPIDDAVLREALDRLLHLEGQRISYRNLEVEQIGSVYEALMGFTVQRAATPAVPLKGGVYVELGSLAEAEHPMLYLEEVTGERNARLRAQLPALSAWHASGDVGADRAAVLEALAPLRDHDSPAVPPGRHYLQPGSGRRGSGSHYTPRGLTEPIVRHTLAPLLGERPSAEAILALKVCDPAMGSGAFLAEACRQLADLLVLAWAREGAIPDSRHEPVLVARRRVAERCLYGVDKNPRAVQLARLSLWLITSAEDLPFTFVDHALREGDALVGLDLRQIASFAFQPGKQVSVKEPWFLAAMQSAARTRALITKDQQAMVFARDQHRQLTGWLGLADDEIWDERRVGDLLIASAWAQGSAAEQRANLTRMGDVAWSWYPNPDKEPMPAEAEALLEPLPMRPFHWWLEFPEVFQRKQPGFDAVVGNPPFGGKNNISAENGERYIKLLQTLWPHAHGAADLCAYFFLRTRLILRPGGCFGLVASNTIAQGNTLDTGLRWLVDQGGVSLFRALTDMAWPVKGAAVVVDIVQGRLGAWEGACELDGVEVAAINSSLKSGEELPEPVVLAVNADRCFQGSNVLGKGFTLTPEEAAALLAEDPHRAVIVRPYIGGRELNSNVPTAANEPVPHDRYVISFGERSLEEAEEWPALLDIVRRLVKPERDRNNREIRRRNWWRFAEAAPTLYRTIAPLSRCLAGSQVSKHLLLAIQPTDRVFSHALNVFALDDWHSFAVLQSRLHEHWARAMGSSMKTDLRYTPSTCFETFPFPRPTPAQHAAVSAAGEALYTLRQRLMAEHQQGMTGIWNRVVDPHEDHPDLLELRRLREVMDRAVLDAYGWGDLGPDDKDRILTRLRRLNAERAAEEAAQAAEAGKQPKRQKA
ncbi:MAG: type IIL restriction-modification enzyme MmeI [Pseudomonadota bacterium]